MSRVQIETVRQAAIALYGDERTASSIAAMEQAYLEYLATERSLDLETAREAFGVDHEPFWFNAWRKVRAPYDDQS